METNEPDAAFEAPEKLVEEAQGGEGAGEEGEGWRISQDGIVDGAGEKKAGWYFGKYLGIRKHKAAGTYYGA